MSPPKNLSLLLVEDNPTDRLLIRETLMDSLNAPHHLSEASSLAECLEILGQKNIDAVLLDLGLPDSEGERSFLKILEMAPDVSLLVLTGLEDEEAGVSAMRHGAQDYLIKGQCDGPTLARAVLYAVERHRISSELRDLATRLGETTRRLRDSEARTREIIEANEDAMLVIDENNIVHFANKSSCQMLGMKMDKLLGQPFRYSFDRLRSGDLEIRREDGTTCQVEVRISQTVWDDNKAHLITLRDVTKRKEYERELRLFRTLIDHSSDALEILDAQTGQFLDMNKTGCTRLGYTLEEVKQRRIHDVDTMLNDENWLLRSGLIAKGEVHTLEGIHRTKSGSTFPVEVNLNYVELDRPYFVAVVRDVTERNSLEEQLRQAQKMEAIGTLAGGIAHDFNNIMGAIRGFTELALRRSQDDQVGKFLGTVVTSCERATKLINKILTFSRMQPDSRQQIKLNEIIEESADLLRATIPSTIEIEVDVSPDLPCILASAGQIQQIILNLGTNAMHAMDDGKGKIRLCMGSVYLDEDFTSKHNNIKPGDYVFLCISDTGSGIPAEVLERIFEPFFTTKEQGKGTGLGLSMVHGIVQQHDGVITVKSTPGEGTTFKCYFPVHNEEPDEAPKTNQEEIPGHGETILLVDDEESLLHLGRESLSLLGYNVETCASATQALEKVLSGDNKYDVILTDQTMPEMTGLELARAVIERFPEQRIIISTGYSALLTQEVATEAGVRAIIRKPEGIVKLSQILHKTLKQDKSTPDMFMVHSE